MPSGIEFLNAYAQRGHAEIKRLMRPISKGASRRPRDSAQEASAVVS